MIKYTFILCIACTNFFATCCSEPSNTYVLSLNSDNTSGRWTVENKNASINIETVVPGGIYSDLMRAKVIENILYRDNDVKTRWVSKDTWKYSRTFTVSEEILKKNTVNLVFDGLDTHSYISLNGHPLDDTDNMFVKYQFNVKQYLKEGINILNVEFDSPVNEAKILSDKNSIPPDCVPDLYNGECHVNQLRKMQASFSWDWGPAFPSVGIWKSVHLHAFNSAIISDVLVDIKQSKYEPMWNASFKIYLQASDTSNKLEGHLMVTIEIDNETKSTAHEFVNEKHLKTVDIEKTLSLEISQAQVKTWWPNGLGEQHLYIARVTFQSTEFADEFYEKSIKIGFRTIEVVQEKIDSNNDGLSFYFKINGHPIFMKGSNWIPGNILPEKGYEKNTVDNLLGAAKNAHMNMLRVWGGGVYESDYFYEKCDELGILIWQDFMFACSMYPTKPNFLSSVSVEVEQVVRRLQHHASLALWAGNNENEAALRGNWYDTDKNFDDFKNQYIDLYVQTIRPVVLMNDPTRSYVVSSPSNGLQSEKEGYIAKNPYDPHYGDNHYYNYFQNLWSMDTYPKTRFCSEYGYQSVPSVRTLMDATDKVDDLDIGSEFMHHREHSPVNNYLNMALQMKLQMGVPNTTLPEHYFNQFIYYSQIIQAMAMKTQTEFYRQSQSDWMTMGALYWQLNDVWQAPSWSSIEYGGKWKILHYYAKKFFSPILISPRLFPNKTMKIYLINDLMQAVRNATMIIDTFEWSNLKPIKTISRQVDVHALATEVHEAEVDPLTPLNENNIFYRFRLQNDKSEDLSPYNYIFPVAIKNIKGIKAPKIEMKIENPTNGTDGIFIYDLVITTDEIALFLDIDCSDGWVSDNGFTLTDASRTIQLYATKQMTSKSLSEDIKIHTLFDEISITKK